VSTEEKLSYKNNPELAALAADGNDEACAELLELNMGLVRSIAVRFMGRGAEMEDLMQLGSMGLVKAARSFDAEKGCAFSTYAVPLIMGEIKRYLRDNGQIKVSRATKRLGAMLLAESEKYYTETGNEPHISYLAEKFGISSEEASCALDAVSPVLSLSVPLGEEENGGTVESLIGCSDNATDKLLERVALEEAVSKLTPLWKSILSLRYKRELSQQKTAEILGLSQVKISREEKKLLSFLRNELS